LLRPPEMDPEELERVRIEQVGEYIASNREATVGATGKALRIRKADVTGLANRAGWSRAKGKPWRRTGPQSTVIQAMNQVAERLEYGSQDY